MICSTDCVVIPALDGVLVHPQCVKSCEDTSLYVSIAGRHLRLCNSYSLVITYIDYCTIVPKQKCIAKAVAGTASWLSRVIPEEFSSCAMILASGTVSLNIY